MFLETNRGSATYLIGRWLFGFQKRAKCANRFPKTSGGGLRSGFVSSEGVDCLQKQVGERV